MKKKVRVIKGYLAKGGNIIKKGSILKVVLVIITVILLGCTNYATTGLAAMSTNKFVANAVNSVGDVNGDGIVNTTDARMVLQASVGNITLTDTQKWAADVNGDGEVNTGDASLILQFAVGKIIEFPNIKVTSVTLNKSDISMAVGEVASNLIATIKPDNADNKTVTFSSNNNGVVSIDANGKLTAVEYGSATITATTSNGLTATCTIYVHRDKVILPNGTYSIKLKGTNIAFDVLNFGTANGTNVQLMNYSGNSAQKFKLENINGLVRFWPECASGKVLDIYRAGAPLVAGQNIDIWQLDGSDYIAQEWFLARMHDGTYTIRPLHASSLAIGADGNSAGANVKLAAFNALDENQKWVMEAVTGSDPTQEKLNLLRNKFPNGAYWNHVGGANNPNGYTRTACPNHAVSDATCNGYIYDGREVAWQCHGFALQLGQELFGTSPRTWKTVYNLNNLHVGDIIRYKNDYHTVFVTSISGNSITIADCNSDGHCKIRWDYTMSVSSITGLNYVLTCQ